jgi:hypothetical protein
MATTAFAGGMTYMKPDNSIYFTFGRIEVRMMSHPQSGVMTAICMLAPFTDEWILAFYGNDLDRFAYASHVYSFNSVGEGRAWAMTNFYTDQGRTSEKFYTFAGEWTPNSVTYEVDGFMFRRIENTGNNSVLVTQWDSPNSDSTVNEYSVNNGNGPESLLDVWSGKSMQCDLEAWHCTDEGCESWLGEYSADDPSQAFFMDFFRFYSYTPGKGPDGSDFTLETEDNFDGPSSGELRQDGFEFRDGLAICAFGGSYSGPMPDVSGERHSKAYAPYASMKKGKSWIECHGNSVVYGIARDSRVDISIYNNNGRLAGNVLSCHKKAGKYEAKINTSGLAQGSYIVYLKADNATVAVPMVISGR